jgi:hypothetical protein
MLRMENLDHHYAQLLGLQSPWEIMDVNLDLTESRVTIRLQHPNGVMVKCPECGCDCTIADRAPERQWRHLDTMQFTTVLLAATPRAACPECGIKTVAVPWASEELALYLHVRILRAQSDRSLRLRAAGQGVVAAWLGCRATHHGARCSERIGP